MNDASMYQKQANFLVGQLGTYLLLPVTQRVCEKTRALLVESGNDLIARVTFHPKPVRGPQNTIVFAAARIDFNFLDLDLLHIQPVFQVAFIGCRVKFRQLTKQLEEA